MTTPKDPNKDFDKSYESWLKDPEIQRQRREHLDRLDKKYPPNNDPDTDGAPVRFTQCD